MGRLSLRGRHTRSKTISYNYFELGLIYDARRAFIKMRWALATSGASASLGSCGMHFPLHVAAPFHGIAARRHARVFENDVGFLVNDAAAFQWFYSSNIGRRRQISASCSSKPVYHAGRASWYLLRAYDIIGACEVYDDAKSRRNNGEAEPDFAMKMRMRSQSHLSY